MSAEAESTAASRFTVAWNLAIVALAETDECSAFTLSELALTVPGALGESPYGAFARERVALRLLEECVGYADESAVAPSSPPAGVDRRDAVVREVEERSEDALCSFVRKVNSLGNVETLEDATYMSGLHMFISQKKATLPQVCLGLLKEAYGDQYECANLSGGDRGLLNRDLKEVPSHYSVLRVPILKPADATPFTVGSNLGCDGDLLQNDLSDHQRDVTKPNELPDTVYNTHPEKHDGALRSPENDAIANEAEQVNGTKENLLSSELHEHEKSLDAQGDEDGSTHVAITLDEHKKIALSEGYNILRPQNPSNHCLIGEDGEKGQICIKCGEGGQLLLCTAVSCEIAIHESCLSSSTCFDDKGDFYCPFCFYIQSLNSYHEARKKVSMAQKALSCLISQGLNRISDQPMSENLSGLKNLAKDIYSKHAKQDVNDLSEQMLRHRKSGHTVDLEQVDPIHCDEDKNNHGKCTGGEKSQQTEHIQRFVSNMSSGQEDGMTSNIAADSFSGDNDNNCKKTDYGCHLKVSQNLLQEEAAPNVSDCSTSQEPTSSEHIIKKRKKDTGTPNEGGVSTSKYKTKACKKYAKRYANSVFPHGRRNKLPWSIEEEEVLKDLVQKLPPNSRGGFPWIKILEEGSNIFHRTRQPMDLKDKWRNIQKKEERDL